MKVMSLGPSTIHMKRYQVTSKAMHCCDSSDNVYPKGQQKKVSIQLFPKCSVIITLLLKPTWNTYNLLRKLFWPPGGEKLNFSGEEIWGWWGFAGNKDQGSVAPSSEWKRKLLEPIKDFHNFLNFARFMSLFFLSFVQKQISKKFFLK